MTARGRSGLLLAAMLTWSALGAAGCKGSASPPSGFGVNVTVDASALTATDRARAVSGVLQVGGAEPRSKTLDIRGAIASGELRFRYIPGVTSGALTFAFDALDSAGNVVASGAAANPVNLTAGAASAVSIKLGGGAGKKEKGAPCGAGTECASGFCADGVCCNEACKDVCASCALDGSKGMCTGYAAGTDPEQECGAQVPQSGTGDGGTASTDGATADGASRDAPAGDAPAADAGAGASDGGGDDAPVIRTPDGGTMTTPAACAGTCGGKGMCNYPGRAKACGRAFCNSPTQVASFACDGNGGCGLQLSGCTDYTCDEATSACRTRCADASDCQPGDYCNAVNQCVPKKGDSVACGNETECRSGFCSGGVCCNAACTGPGYSCTTSGSVGKCTCPGVTCPAGVACTLFYLDSDRDGYGDKASTVPGCEGTPPAGYVANSTDCDDADANAHPGQTQYFATVSRGKGLFDYDCSGTNDKETPEYPGASCRFCGPTTACESSSSTCTSTDQPATLSCAAHSYICSLCRVGEVCSSTCTCCGCTGTLLRVTYLSSGFNATVACGANGTFVTCSGCAAAAKPATSSSVAKQQRCR